MNIQPIKDINNVFKDSFFSEKKGSESPFKNIFDSAMANIESTNELEKKADQMSIDFAVGKINSVADVMIAQEKATIALQYTVQLRNKLLDAYKEIMRMQV